MGCKLRDWIGRVLIAGAVFAGSCWFLVPEAKAAIGMTDNNSDVLLNLTNQRGVSGWRVDYTNILGVDANQLTQQWLWYRIGSTPAQSLDTAFSIWNVNSYGSRGIAGIASNAQFNVVLTYIVAGGSQGSGQSTLDETIYIKNPSTVSALDFHLFQYSNYNLDSDSNDVVQLGRSSTGVYNEAVQKRGTNYVVETVFTPGANHCEAALYPSTLNELNGGTALTLNDVAGPIGPGNATWAVEWDFSIPPTNSIVIGESAHFTTNGLASTSRPLMLINQSSSTNVTLSWPGGYTLLSSTNVSGPYNDVSGAAPPYSTDTTAQPAGFFGLRN